MDWNQIINHLDQHYPLLHDLTDGGVGYGTAGFRTKGHLLPPIAARLTVIAVLRGYWHTERASLAHIGFMITASHNPHDDNGFKIIDYDGKMLPGSWEHWCTAAVNTTGAEFYRVVTECCQHELKKMPENLSFNKIHLIIGTDTRITGESISKAVVDILGCLGVKHTVHTNVTTPQLHYVVVQCNLDGFSHANPDGFHKNLIVSFETLLKLTDATAKGEKIHIVIDASNGVGALAIEKLLKVSDEIKDSSLRKCFDITVLNKETQNPEGLNHLCGADFVNRHKQPSQSMATFANSSVGSYSDTHYYCLDGDADRIVALDHSENRWTLMDGDRISILYAFLLHKIFEPRLIAKMDIGIVQTAYANGASTLFVRETLKMKCYIAATGVKNIHPVAAARGIGVYFEANGHGTVLFDKNKINKMLTFEPENERERIRCIVDTMSRLVSQFCGDAIGDLLLCEVALRVLGLKFNDLRKLYSDRPAMQVKVDVPFPKKLTTTLDETRALSPDGLQDELDKIVEETLSQLGNTKGPYARCFARPSGTESVVRVYSEATTEESCKWLSDRACDAVRKYCC